MLILSPAIYMVSLFIPLIITLEILNLICLTTANTTNNASANSRKASSAPTITSSNVNVRTMICLLKYWCLYAIFFGLFPSNLTWTVLSVVPFGSLIFLVFNGLITLELLYQFIEFIESQDGKVLFLFNKFNDSNVSWWQWFSYATTYDENNVATNFVFGKLTQFLISLANRSPFSRTNYLERGFDVMELYLKQFTQTIIMQRKNFVQSKQGQGPSVPEGGHHKRATRAFPGPVAGLHEGYDLLDDIIEESRQRKL